MANETPEPHVNSDPQPQDPPSAPPPKPEPPPNEFFKEHKLPPRRS
jgi:hypothetical protein